MNFDSASPPPFDEGRRKWKRFGCYVPLLAIGLEVIWCLMLFLGLIFMVGDAPFTNTEAKSRMFDLAASLPAITGLVTGIFAMSLRWPQRRLDWVSLISGAAGCGLLTACFANGLVN